jgi:predicted nucleic acid-binding protein
MAIAGFLVDKSAAARASSPDVAERYETLLAAGQLAMCSMFELEMLYSARSGHDFHRLDDDMCESYELLHTDQEDFDRAKQVMGELAVSGRHRAVSIPDLLIAAVAERNEVTVLHYDADFDLIADVTGQRTEWVVPRGTL